MRRRLVIFLLIAAILAAMAVPVSGADAGSIVLVAIDDSLPYALDDATMPQYLNGLLYIPAAFLADSRLGISVSWNSADQTESLSGSSASLVFSLQNGTVSDGTETSTAWPALLRNGNVFIPLYHCAEVFGFSVSQLNSADGYVILRLTSGNEIYSDSLFTEKAENLISARVSAYLGTDSVSPAAGSGTSSGQSGQQKPASSSSQQTAPSTQQASSEPADTSEETEPEETEEETSSLTVYTAATGTAGLEEYLSAAAARGVTPTVFLTAYDITASPETVFSLYCSGAVIGLTLPENCTDAGQALAEANDALWQLLHLRTDLILLPADSEPAAGYFTLTACDCSIDKLEACVDGSVLITGSGTEVCRLLTRLEADSLTLTLRTTDQLTGSAFTNVFSSEADLSDTETGSETQPDRSGNTG